MKRYLTIVFLIVSLVLSGCGASKEQMSAYYNTIDKGNEAIIATVEKQGQEIRDLRNQQMKFFGQAMVEAAKTDDPTDNAVIAFAWGYQAATPLKLDVPSIKFPAAPVTDVDRVRAWTPIVGMAMPLITPLFYGWGQAAGGGAGDKYTATDNATIMVDAGNAGSYNVAREGSQQNNSGSQVTNQHDDNIGSSGGAVAPGADGECPSGYSLRESTGTCITEACEAQIDGGGDDFTGACAGGTVNPIDQGTGETCEVTGGFFNSVNGKYYADEFFSCSCGSRAAGEC